MTAQPIKYKLVRVRNRMARLALRNDLVMATLLLAAVFTTAVWYERHLYFSSVLRTALTWLVADLALLLVLVITVRWLGTWRGWWPWVRPEAIAARVGHRLDTAPDRLLNALQLERRLATEKDLPNSDLLTHSVHQVAKKLTHLDSRALTPRRYHPPRRVGAALGVLILLAWVMAPGTMAQATRRLLNPERDYPVPTPFILVNLTGDMKVLGGDASEVAFTAVGSIPPDVELVWDDHLGRVHTAKLPLSRDRYVYRFENMGDDIRYFARYVNRAWFSPWDQISSKTHTITIIDRPVIEELTFTIVPPKYTGEAEETAGGNVADITALVGSAIKLEGTTNLPLKSAWMDLGGDITELAIQGRTLSGGFELDESTEMIISVTDKRDVSNANPIRYRFSARPDYPPNLTVVLPAMLVDLDESLILPIQVDVSDDFGFSRAQISYSIRHPDYLTSDGRIDTRQITELVLESKSQRLTHIWALAPLGLMPGDEVRLQIEVFDNNVRSGPGQAVSSTIIARVPTLADLFAQAAERARKATSTTENVLEDLEEVRALLEEMELAFRADDQVSWEQQQKGKEVLETLDDVLAAMESVQERLERMGAQAQENNLFSDAILQKYEELQNLLSEIMTPELEEAMARLREALENMDPLQIKNAMQNMQFQAAEMEAQLDRFLDVFRRALAEMKMAEVVRRLEQLAATEEQLLKDLAEAATSPAGEGEAEPTWRLPDLAARHLEQERALNAARQTMGDAAEALQPYSSQAAQELSDLRDAELTRNTNATMQQGTLSLQSGQASAGQASLEQGHFFLQALRDEAIAIQERFQQYTVSNMLAKFQRVLSGVLVASKQQEQLYLEAEGLSRSSPRVLEAAEAQHMLLKGMGRLIEQMIALGRESFHITPEIGRVVGRANAAMHKAVSSLEANDPPGAVNSQKESMTALNETAVALNNAMSSMQQSGSASGYEQYLQRMANLTQGQQGLNAQVLSMQLGQMAGMSRLELARRLQARQRQLARVLEDILDDFSAQSGGREGGLGQSLEDMEEVIRDFQRRRITRRTLDRQQRIVTRLLDSQKSLAVQDFKKERKGEQPAQLLSYTGPSGLPTNLGERDDLIMQAMEKALRSGYSADYQAIIQDYFQMVAGSSRAHE